MEKYFADNHASPDSQLGHAYEGAAQTPQTDGLGYEALLSLAKEYNWQLRYREAIPIYTQAIILNPHDIRGYRQRAGKYLTTLQPTLARKDLERCRELGGDEMDLAYRLGLCHYLLYDNRKAMESFEACYPLCDDEMGIAVIFWHTLSAWRAGAVPILLRDHYRSDMKVGHHTAYAFVMECIRHSIPFSRIRERLESEESDLEFSIMAYGIGCYLSHLGKTDAALALRSELLRRDGFWISYAYIAAWNDAHNNCDALEES